MPLDLESPCFPAEIPHGTLPLLLGNSYFVYGTFHCLQQVECSRCGGKGFFVSESALPKRCRYCAGLGTVECPDCDERRCVLLNPAWRCRFVRANMVLWCSCGLIMIRLACFCMLVQRDVVRSLQCYQSLLELVGKIRISCGGRILMRRKEDQKGPRIFCRADGSPSNFDAFERSPLM